MASKKQSKQDKPCGCNPFRNEVYNLGLVAEEQGVLSTDDALALADDADSFMDNSPNAHDIMCDAKTCVKAFCAVNYVAGWGAGHDRGRAAAYRDFTQPSMN